MRPMRRRMIRPNCGHVLGRTIGAANGETRARHHSDPSETLIEVTTARDNCHSLSFRKPLILIRMTG
jgi:hypothetical protein